MMDESLRIEALQSNKIKIEAFLVELQWLLL